MSEKINEIADKGQVVGRLERKNQVTEWAIGKLDSHPVGECKQCDIIRELLEYLKTL